MTNEDVERHWRRCEGLRRTLAEHGLDALLVTSRANQRYLVGFDASTAGLWVTARSLLLQVDARYGPAAERWQAALGPAARVAVSTGHWLDGEPPEAAGRIGVEADHLPASAWLALCRGPLEPIPSRGLVESLRALKDPGELRHLGRAAMATEVALRSAVAGLRCGLTEGDVARGLSADLRSFGEESLAFPTVVVAGPRTGWPHPQASGRILRCGEPVLLDAGCRVGGYAADLAVTTWLGVPPPPLRLAQAAVRHALQRGAAAARAGQAAAAVDAACRLALRAWGLSGDYPHDTGHGVGLEVHEPPRIAPDSADVLEAGMVIALEPAWYDPALGGVRLEQMFLVRPAGGACPLGGEGRQRPTFPLLRPS